MSGLFSWLSDWWNGRTISVKVADIQKLTSDLRASNRELEKVVRENQKVGNSDAPRNSGTTNRS